MNKSLIKIFVIGSMFCVFSVSFGLIISLSNNDLDNFWLVKNIYFPGNYNVYAAEKCSIVYDTVTTASGKKVQQQREVCDNTTSNLLSSNKDINITLNSRQKLLINGKIKELSFAIDNKIILNSNKLIAYENFSKLLDNKILLSEELKKRINNKDTVLNKYNRKILFFTEFKKNVGNKIQVLTKLNELNNKKTEAKKAVSSSIAQQAAQQNSNTTTSAS